MIHFKLTLLGLCTALLFLPVQAFAQEEKLIDDRNDLEQYSNEDYGDYTIPIYFTVESPKDYGLKKAFGELARKFGWIELYDWCDEGIYCVGIEFEDYQAEKIEEVASEVVALGEVEVKGKTHRLLASFDIDQTVIRVKYPYRIKIAKDNQLLVHDLKKNSVLNAPIDASITKVSYFTDEGLAIPKTEHLIEIEEELMRMPLVTYDENKVQAAVANKISLYILGGFIEAGLHPEQLKGKLPDLHKMIQEQHEVWEIQSHIPK